MPSFWVRDAEVRNEVPQGSGPDDSSWNGLRLLYEKVDFAEHGGGLDLTGSWAMTGSGQSIERELTYGVTTESGTEASRA